jgi:hypothetical protein
MHRVLAFDIGIKNLAWCFLEKETAGQKAPGPAQIKGWANENLISGDTVEIDISNNRCRSCSHKANYWHASSGAGYCVKHCPPLTPALRDLSGNLCKKLPKIEVLRELCKRAEANKAEMKTKALMLKFLETHYCFPKPPAPKAKGTDMIALHNGIRALVLKHQALWQQATHILLENQPAFKNPVMKSVQMMLFATLRDLLPGQPGVALVHAGRKTAAVKDEIAAGDEGYADRKGVGEDRVAAAFKTKKLIMACSDGRLANWFFEQKKRSDLADCCCMCLDSMAAAGA